MEQSVGTLSCTILDRRSSIPLSGARVNCVWRDNRVSTLRLDQHGSFRIDLPEGVYDLVISAHGFLSLLLRGIGVLSGYEMRLMRALVPGAGQTVEGEPATAIGGFVVDRLGRPLCDISVRATGEGKAYTTRTDRRGAYMMHGVNPAFYDVEFGFGTRYAQREEVPIASVRSFVRVDAKLLNA